MYIFFYFPDKKQIKRLLNTAKGQIDGIIKMINEDKYCIEISNQILASIAILKKANMEMEALSDENSRLYLVMCKCMPWQMSDFEKQLTEEQLADMIREHYNVLYEEDADIGDISVYDFG